MFDKKTGVLRYMGSVAVAIGLLATASVHAQTWPSTPVSLIVGFAPGGSSDIIARTLAQELTGVLGQSVIVENKPGAGATIAAAHVAGSKPDGHTLLLVTSGHAGSGAMYKSLRYDPIKSFMPVIRLASTPVVIVVPSSQPWKSLGALIAAARQAPGKLNYAAGGGGATTTALTAEFLKKDRGIDMVQVAYKGSAPALTALIGGEVEVGFEIPSSSLQHINTGKLRALAVTSRNRSSVLPDVPTAIEAGIDNFEVIGWFGILAPAGTPDAIVSRLNSEINGLLNKSEMRKKLAALGLEVGGGTPQEFQSLIDSDTGRYGEAIRRLGIGAK